MATTRTRPGDGKRSDAGWRRRVAITVCALGLATSLPGSATEAPNSRAVAEVSRRLAVPSEQLRSNAVHVLSRERAVPLATLKEDAGAAPTLAQRVGTQVMQVAPSEFGRELEVPEAAYALPVKFRALAGASPQTAVPVEFQPIVVVVSSLR